MLLEREEGGRSFKTLALAEFAGAFALLTGRFAGRLGGFAGGELFTDGGRLLLLLIDALL